ncbi:unnamed protein product, partial [Cladocopium goreaui]
AATAAWSPEDRAWELLLAIAGAHAEPGVAGRSDLRRLAAEAKRLLAEFPIEETESSTREATEVASMVWMSSCWKNLKAVLSALWGFLCFVMTFCQDIITVLAPLTCRDRVAAALGQEPAEDTSRASGVERPQAKQKSQQGRVTPQAGPTSGFEGKTSLV